MSAGRSCSLRGGGGTPGEGKLRKGKLPAREGLDWPAGRPLGDRPGGHGTTGLCRSGCTALTAADPDPIRSLSGVVSLPRGVLWRWAWEMGVVDAMLCYAPLERAAAPARGAPWLK